MSIRIRLGCSRCPALCPGELQHKLHAEPDQRTHDDHDRRVGVGLCGRRGTQVLAGAKVKPLQDGLTALNTAIANVKTSLDTVAASTSAVLQPAVEQVKTAFAGLQTAASGLTADNLKQKAPSIDSAITQIGTATTALASTLTQNCPAS